MIQPAPYGSELITSGWPSSVSLRAVTVPSTGPNSSETLLVDSTSPNGSPLVIYVPTSGNDTYTTSPSDSWAKSVIPIRTVEPEMRAHSCSAVYFRSSGTSAIAADPPFHSGCVVRFEGTLPAARRGVLGVRQLTQRGDRHAWHFCYLGVTSGRAGGRGDATRDVQCRV